MKPSRPQNPTNFSRWSMSEYQEMEEKKKKRERKLYHGTTTLKAVFIKESGLKPLKHIREEVDITQGTSDKTNPDYIYLFDDPATAKIYAELVGERDDLPPTVLEVDVIDESKLEPDLELPHSFKMEGIILPENIKEVDITKISREDNKIDQMSPEEKRKWRRKYEREY